MKKQIGKDMKRVRRFSLMALLLLAATAVKAQDDKMEATVAADVVNQYIWRGQDCGNVSIQPTLGVAYKGLSLTAWGSVGIDKDDTKEFDLTAAYSIAGFNVGVTDYWFNNTDGRYFDYAAHTTAHVLEANVGYDLGFLSVQWYTNFAGADGVNKNGKRAYSSYAELAAPFRLGGCEWEAAVGIVPYATTSYDTNGFAVTNVSLRATKALKITDHFSLPVFAGIVANPRAEKAYLTFGFTLQP